LHISDRDGLRLNRPPEGAEENNNVGGAFRPDGTPAHADTARYEKHRKHGYNNKNDGSLPVNAGIFIHIDTNLFIYIVYFQYIWHYFIQNSYVPIVKSAEILCGRERINPFPAFFCKKVTTKQTKFNSAFVTHEQYSQSIFKKFSKLGDLLFF